jgi:peptidyl-prolyl cis-trans isomerase SurA
MKRNVFTLLLAFSATVLVAQTNDPVVMKINGKEINKSEFDYIYNKNNSAEVLTQNSLEEYITLFKNFKLKIAEAESQGMDTTKSFHQELDNYRTQLAKTYLKAESDEKLAQEAMPRVTNASEISAILINFPKTDKLTPADTLATYQKALEAYNKAIAKGAIFEDVVKEYTNDEQAKTAERPGYAGWFAGFNLITPLEIPVHTTPAGGVTRPIRIPFGYYIVKVNDKRQEEGTEEVTFEKIRPQIEQKMANSGLFAQIYKPGLNRLKKEYGYSENAKAYQALTKAAETAYPLDSAYITPFEEDETTLFTIDKEPIAVADFIYYLKQNPYSYSNLSTEVVADKYQQFVYQNLLSAENNHLESKYPEFKNLMQEYRDGILLFEVSSREVWDKAAGDTLGLENYFATHKENYTSGKTDAEAPKSYKDVRGLVITDYQDFLEQEWIKLLNSKYPVIIYEDKIKNK